MNLQLFGGRGGTSAGGGGSGSRSSAGPTKADATSTFRGIAGQLASGGDVNAVTIGGINYANIRQSSYVSGGGFVVNQYEFATTAQSGARNRAFTVTATEYKDNSGTVVSQYRRRKPQVLKVNAHTTVGVRSGRSGGI